MKNKKTSKKQTKKTTTPKATKELKTPVQEQKEPIKTLTPEATKVLETTKDFQKIKYQVIQLLETKLAKDFTFKKLFSPIETINLLDLYKNGKEYIYITETLSVEPNPLFESLKRVEKEPVEFLVYNFVKDKQTNDEELKTRINQTIAVNNKILEQANKVVKNPKSPKSKLEYVRELIELLKRENESLNQILADIKNLLESSSTKESE